MGVARRPEDALFFVGSLFSDEMIFDVALDDLKVVFGPVLFLSSAYPWDVSDYYQKELGSPLMRRFVFFSDVVDPAGLVRAKHAVSSIEGRLSCEGKRRINLDPGYITLAKVVLASWKNYSHRICLGSGVYAELELFCENACFQSLPYTYRDYRDISCIQMFNSARSRLKKILKAREERSSPERDSSTPDHPGENPLP